MKTPKLVSLVTLLFSSGALAATDPCATTFEKIATALELGRGDSALNYFSSTDRAAQLIKEAAATPEAAKSLATVFRTAKLKSTFDSTAIYSSNWEASAGHSIAIDIGTQVGQTGCLVQAW